MRGRQWAASLALTAGTVLASGCQGSVTPGAGDTTNAGALSWGDANAAYARLTMVELGAGAHAVLGKGGNSIVLEDEETLLFDTKFGTTWPLDGASSLRDWVAANTSAKVTKIVNSHYHYDHSFGNPLYPDADVYAHADSRALMLAVDPGQWGSDDAPAPGLPTRTLDPVTVLAVGARSVEVHLSGAGHTAGDAWLRIPKESLGEDAQSDVIATGDLMFHTYYPFFDEGDEGSSLAGDASTLHALARSYPDARFVPGHGPLCSASDLDAYASYLEDMLAAIDGARAGGLDEDGAVASVRPSERWNRLLLPSPHHGLAWATAESSFRAAYRIVARRGP